jgi:autocrine motility factor receptor
LLVLVTSVHVLLKYALHLYDVHCIKNGVRRGSERRAAVLYWVEVGFDFLLLNIDLVHHVHMIIWTKMILSMASLIIFMQLRYLIHELQQLFRRHSSHCKVHKLVHKK